MAVSAPSVPHYGCCWYWLSVAVKKSSRTLCMYSKVGRSSGLIFQHLIMTSYSSLGQLSVRGMRYPRSRALITSTLDIPGKTGWDR